MCLQSWIRREPLSMYVLFLSNSELQISHRHKPDNLPPSFLLLCSFKWWSLLGWKQSLFRKRSSVSEAKCNPSAAMCLQSWICREPLSMWDIYIYMCVCVWCNKEAKDRLLLQIQIQHTSTEAGDKARIRLPMRMAVVHELQW